MEENNKTLRDVKCGDTIYLINVDCDMSDKFQQICCKVRECTVTRLSSSVGGDSHCVSEGNIEDMEEMLIIHFMRPDGIENFRFIEPVYFDRTYIDDRSDIIALVRETIPEAVKSIVCNPESYRIPENSCEEIKRTVKQRQENYTEWIKKDLKIYDYYGRKQEKI